MRVQIVCRRTTFDELNSVLSLFSGIELKSCRGHILVEVCDRSVCVADVLHVCRRNNRYAYLRLATWEFGGGNERSGEATCVCGPKGEPLKPVPYQVSVENQANGLHALFTSRSELITSIVERMGTAYSLKVIKRRILRRELHPDEVLFQKHVELGESADIRRWLDSFPNDADPFIPVIRATIRKVRCLFCTHTHYRSIEGLPTEGRKDEG